MACSSLRVGRAFREDKMAVAVATGNRSYAEVVGRSKPSEEERFYADKKPIAAVLKEASVSMEVPVSVYNGREKGQTSTQPALGVAQVSMEKGGYNQKLHIALWTSFITHRWSVCNDEAKLCLSGGCMPGYSGGAEGM